MYFCLGTMEHVGVADEQQAHSSGSKEQTNLRVLCLIWKFHWRDFLQSKHKLNRTISENKRGHVKDSNLT